MKKSKIEWTQETWNPTTGCNKVSPGCKYCYAEVMANRLKAIGIKGYENGFEFSILQERFEQPLKRKKPTVFFVNSMSDLFHKKMTKKHLDYLFEIMESTPQHVYQILTKRDKNMLKYFTNKKVPDNVWIGVSVEDIKHGFPRINSLKKINAKVKFLSIEPLLENLGKISFKGIDWVIVGGESGANARKMDLKWVIMIRNQCIKDKTPFFFKQWGAYGEDGIKRNKKANGRTLQNREWNEYPINSIVYSKALNLST